ncbi:MAG: HlyD family efflux transporter periplasmic adaptor subunit, partial [Actinomycetota bacterium]
GLARRDAAVGDLDEVKIEGDTAASVSSIQASVASARETIASITSDILKLEVELQNTRLRRQQQWVRAPRNGRVVRLMKAGAGETVKAGDVMAVLAPDTPERAVELYLSDNDAPLVEVGRPVRLQFAGWPALQFTGWPSVAVGTFAGKVAVVDAIDDGTSRYRIIVTPDDAGGQDDRWPDARYLRPGGEATGWVMLDTVSLGFEMWRQFNAFPPTVERGPIGKDKSGAGGDQKAEKEGQIKRKAGK